MLHSLGFLFFPPTTVSKLNRNAMGLLLSLFSGPPRITHHTKILWCPHDEYLTDVFVPVMGDTFFVNTKSFPVGTSCWPPPRFSSNDFSISVKQRGDVSGFRGYRCFSSQGRIVRIVLIGQGDDEGYDSMEISVLQPGSKYTETSHDVRPSGYVATGVAITFSGESGILSHFALVGFRPATDHMHHTHLLPGEVPKHSIHAINTQPDKDVW